MLDAHHVSLRGQCATLYPQCVCPPGNPRPPLRFISATPTERMPEVRNVCVEPSQRGGRSRVSADVSIPVELCFCDAAGCRFTAQEVILVPMQACLRVPDCAPYTIEAMARLCVTCGEAGPGMSFRVTFNAEVCLYAATMHRDERCFPACPPHCDCERCRSRKYFQMPLYPL